MAATIIANARCWLGGYDLSGHLNAVSIEPEAPAVDVTTIQDTWTKATPGMKRVSAQLEGFWSAGITGEPDPILWNVLGVVNTPITFAPSATEGTVAYSFLASVGTFTPGASFGEILKFSVSAEG